ncbi:hypothetical protein K2X96_00555 [Patescibacteria group bacterium]|nr:hypothetical protein [Patescibacteria group bacterium]
MTKNSPLQLLSTFFISSFIFSIVFLYADSVRAQEFVAPAPVVVDEVDAEYVTEERNTPAAPVITSDTFLDQNTWYATTTGTFFWDLGSDEVTALALSVSALSTDEPATRYPSLVEEVLLDGDTLKEGTQYLHIQFKSESEWGAVAHRMIRIDLTAPKNVEVGARHDQENGIALIPEAEDELSGIAHYTISIDGGVPQKLSPVEAKRGYEVGFLNPGSHTVEVMAVDKAGNSTKTSMPLVVVGASTMPISESTMPSLWVLFTFPGIFILLLLCLIFALVASIKSEREALKTKEAQLRKETKEVQDQIEKIFSALRTEIHTQMQSLTKRPRLTKNQQAVVVGLESALAVSETLIEKEIIDVQEILK